MREFFHGWRRKAGCVTLVMSLTTLGLRARTCFNDDAFTFSICGRTHMIRNWGGCVSWYGWAVLKDARDTPTWTSGSPLPPSDTWEAFIHRFPHEEYAQAAYEIRNEPVEKSWDIRHRTILMPLTLLSAYLLLWVPRQRTEPEHA